MLQASWPWPTNYYSFHSFSVYFKFSYLSNKIKRSNTFFHVIFYCIYLGFVFLWRQCYEYSIFFYYSTHYALRPVVFSRGVTLTKKPLRSAIIHLTCRTSGYGGLCINHHHHNDRQDVACWLSEITRHLILGLTKDLWSLGLRVYFQICLESDVVSLPLIVYTVSLKFFVFFGLQS